MAPCGACFSALCRSALFRKPRLRQLLYLEHQAIQHPLRFHLGLGSQREAVQLLFVAQIGEHQLHGALLVCILRLVILIKIRVRPRFDRERPSTVAFDLAGIL